MYNELNSDYIDQLHNIAKELKVDTKSAMEDAIGYIKNGFEGPNGEAIAGMCESIYDSIISIFYKLNELN